MGALPAALAGERPKGEQLQEILEGVIADLEPGALLPPERTLAERYGVARATVTQAIQALVSRGLVYRVHGSGTFVAEPKFRQPLTLTSFTEDMRARGMTPGSLVLHQAVVPAGEVVARHRKLFPFLPYESGVAAGTECTVFDVPKEAAYVRVLAYLVGKGTVQYDDFKVEKTEEPVTPPPASKRWPRLTSYRRNLSMNSVLL